MKKIHAAAFFTNRPPVYRAAYTRARTVKGQQRAAACFTRDIFAAFPAAYGVKTLISGDASPPKDWSLTPPLWIGAHYQGGEQ